MSCSKYAHEHCHVLNDYSSRLSISSSSATQRPVYHSRPATVEVSTSYIFCAQAFKSPESQGCLAIEQ